MGTMPAMNLERIRGARGWSRPKLARESGVSVPTLERIERDPDYDPRISRVRRLATALDVSLDDLVFDHDPERPTSLDGHGSIDDTAPDGARQRSTSGADHKGA